MRIEQAYALRLTRHAVQDLDAMFTHINYELDAEPAAKALMRDIEYAISTCGNFPTRLCKPVTIC